MHPRARSFFLSRSNIDTSDRSRLLMAVLGRMTCRCQFVVRSLLFFISCYSWTRVSNVLLFPIPRGINISSSMCLSSFIASVLSVPAASLPIDATIRKLNLSDETCRKSEQQNSLFTFVSPVLGVCFFYFLLGILYLYKTDINYLG